MMWLGVCFLGSNFFGTLWASWKSISFARLRKFSLIMFSNKFSISCPYSSPPGTPMIRMLECLKLSQRFLSLSSFFLNSWFFILFWLNVYFFLSFQTIDLSPSFLPFTVGSLYIFLYFTLYSLHFFCHHTQPFLWASWLPVFWTVYLIGWLSLHHLVVFFLELWSVLSFGPYFFLSGYTCYVVRGGALGIHQGRATHSAALWWCGWGRGLRENNVICSALCWLSVTSPATHKQIGSLWCWFPGGWFCVPSRILWVPVTTSPERLELSPSASIATDFFSQRFWGFISSCWNPGLHVLSCCPVVLLSLSTCKHGTALTATSSTPPWYSSHCLAVSPFCLAACHRPSYRSGWVFLL